MPTLPADKQTPSSAATTPTRSGSRSSWRARLTPFAGLSNPKEVWAWGMFDLANQSFTLLIITLLFPLFFKQVIVGEPMVLEALTDAGVTAHVAEEFADNYATYGRSFLDNTTDAGITELEQLELTSPDTAAAVEQAFTHAASAGDQRWSMTHAGSLLVVVLLSPILGALADARAKRKEFLIAMGLVCCVATIALGFSGPGLLALAVALYVVGNIGYQLSENFLASFLPTISTRKTIGRVSALGWSMGYLGALLLLVVLFVAMQMTPWSAPPDWKPFIFFAGGWFLFAMLPTIFILRDDTVPDPAASPNPLTCAFSRLSTTLSHASQFKHLALFLASFLLYGFGVQVIVAFASIIAGDFGIRGSGLVVFVAVITITAGLAAFVTSTFQDKLGTKNTLLAYLGVWTISALGLLSLEIASSPALWMFWLVGNGIGFALGGAGTATRAMVAQFTPKHRSAEFLGLWGLTNKLAGVVGVLSFGSVRAQLGDVPALVLLTSFFVLGFVGVLLVNERAGIYAARNAEREHRG